MLRAPRPRRLPVQELKIDRSFVLAMSSDADDAAIVRSTIALAHSLRLQVVAEGVEDAEAWRTLAELGCASVQGFHLSRPLPAIELTAWLRGRADDGAGPVSTAGAAVAVGSRG